MKVSNADGSINTCNQLLVFTPTDKSPVPLATRRLRDDCKNTSQREEERGRGTERKREGERKGQLTVYNVCSMGAGQARRVV